MFRTNRFNSNNCTEPDRARGEKGPIGYISEIRGLVSQIFTWNCTGADGCERMLNNLLKWWGFSKMPSHPVRSPIGRLTDALIYVR
jgi:hypothetical protein